MEKVERCYFCGQTPCWCTNESRVFQTRICKLGDNALRPALQYLVGVLIGAQRAAKQSQHVGPGAAAFNAQVLPSMKLAIETLLTTEETTHDPQRQADTTTH